MYCISTIDFVFTIFTRSPVKLNLEGYNLKNLRYLQHGDTRQDEAEDAIRFQAWKACLGTYEIQNNFQEQEEKKRIQIFEEE